MILRFLIVGALGALLASASETTVVGPGVQPSAGLTIGFVAQQSGQGLDTAHDITYEVLNAKSNRTVTVFLPEDPAQLCMLDLFNTEGERVLKTTLGRQLGARFDELEQTVKLTERIGPRTIFQSSSNTVTTRSFRVDGGASMPILPAPERLFQITKPGTYTLRLQIQCYIPITNDIVRLYRLAPAEVSLIKR